MSSALLKECHPLNLSLKGLYVTMNIRTITKRQTTKYQITAKDINIESSSLITMSTFHSLKL